MQLYIGAARACRHIYTYGSQSETAIQCRLGHRSVRAICGHLILTRTALANLLYAVGGRIGAQYRGTAIAVVSDCVAGLYRRRPRGSVNQRAAELCLRCD